jgi:diguanylate cyclase (GGDEF)-like protein
VAGSGIRCGLRRYRGRSLLLLATLLAAWPAVALRRFDARDGLSQNTVNAMARDDRGVLWFASDSGLSRFDGRSFSLPPASIAAELDGLVITALAADGAILWVGTRGDGVKRVDLQRQQVVSIRPSGTGLADAAVRAIVVDGQGDVWLGSDGDGVVRIDWNDGAPQFARYLAEAGGPPHARFLTMAIEDDSTTGHANIGTGQLALSDHVAPFWWERPGMQITAILLLLLAAGLLYHGRIHVLRSRERWLSNEVRLRTREIEQQKSELALANQQLYELSIRDGLTGVFNRRHSLEEARRLLRSERERAISIALIDLDHFKAINDRFGHIAGDEALRCFARWLKDQSGPGDVFGRYGGEEFFCLLFDRDIHQAKHWADTLLARVRSAEVAGPNCEIRITASIGIVAIDPHAELPLEIWIARADAALYRAKANGRDSVLIG